MDIAVANGMIAKVSDNISAQESKKTIDASGFEKVYATPLYLIFYKSILLWLN